MVSNGWPFALGLALLTGCVDNGVDEGLTAQSSGLATTNGLSVVNGLSVHNGLSSNGLSSNGLSSNGLSSNGLSVHNGLSVNNGLSSTVGLMTTAAGRNTVAYIVRCALAAGDTLVKADQYNNLFTFKGSIGLAPEYKTGACDTGCQESLSACLEAHVNTAGVHIPLWIVAPMSAVGWDMSPSYPTREGTFFGNIMVTNAAGTIDPYYCNGPGFDSNTVPGRIGANQGAPFVNAYASTTGLCSPSCTMNGTIGAASCPANGVTWTRPITVWRGQTFQAENATKTGTAANVACATCSNGARVTTISSTSSVTFANVAAATTGTNNLIVYYTNGDTTKYAHFFNISVNGGAVQSRSFLPTGAWDKPAAASVSLSGFVAGSANVVAFLGDTINLAPDLDWIEVVGATSDYCDHNRWSLTASSAGAQDPILNSIDGAPVTRWTSAKPQDGTEWFQIDFGGSVKMSTMTLTNGGYDPSDYPGGYAVYASIDGVSFGSVPIATGVGALNATVITFPEQTLRAMRIKQTSAVNASHWWSIHEFDTDCSVPTPTPASSVNYCATSRWKATASAGNSPSYGIDGDLTTRWTGSSQDGTDWYRVDFGGTVKLSGITLDNSQGAGSDSLGGYALYRSTDGTTFDSTPFVTGNGSPTATVVTFPQQTFRAIKVAQKGTGNKYNKFSIGELKVPNCAM